ncbi:LuxR C-terminal-related transcriptional regulator [Microbispora sp. CA-102843]|uniref:LuxR C-terminal-related transcriptional regulator n=1 Tax=Microbispora sp. CA-102843 TaxID=3239952 RepID=UPI003D929F7F
MIRVLLIDSVRIVREGLAAILSGHAEIEVVASTAASAETIRALLKYRPSVMIWSSCNLEHEEVALLTRLCEENPDCRMLILTQCRRPERVQRALTTRVAGILATDTCSEHVIDAIRTVASGRRVLDPELAFAMVTVRANPLSDREMEILGLLASGVGPHDIARKISLSPGTIRNYLASVVRKLNARNRLDAIRIAAERGLLH